MRGDSLSGLNQYRSDRRDLTHFDVPALAERLKAVGVPPVGGRPQSATPTNLRYHSVASGRIGSIRFTNRPPLSNVRVS